jgi:phosphopantetheinyl transferase
MVAAAFYGEQPGRDGPPPRTGCDIQYAGFRKAHRAIAEAFFSPEERAYIDEGRGDPEKNLRFHHIWT